MTPNKFILGAALLCTFACCKKDDDDGSTSLNDTDRDFMMKASHSNYNEIDAGNAAANQGMMAAVKSFGSMMVMDHTTAQEELKTVGTQAGVGTLPTMPDSLHMALTPVLLSKTGRSFDSMYMKMQVMDHAATIALMQNEIANGSDLRVKNYANSKLPVVMHHKHMADSIVTANGF